MKRGVWIGIFVFLVSLPGWTQTKKKPEYKQDTVVKTEQYLVRTTPENRKILTRKITPQAGTWSLEGAFGMAFGNQTTLNAVVQTSYSRNIYFALGGGLSYSHYYSSHESVKANYIGLNLMARIKPFPYLAFQFQPELLERWGKRSGEKSSNQLVPTLLAGGGFFLPAGPGSIYLMFFFDLIQNKYTPYGKNLYYTLGYAYHF